MSLARGATIVGLRIPRLRRRGYGDRGVSDFLAVDARLDKLIAVGERLPWHREPLGSMSSKQSVQLLVVSGHAELGLRFHVVVFQIVVIDWPVASDTVGLLQPKVCRQESRAISAPRPRATSNQAGVAGAERVRGLVVVVVLFGER